MDTDVGNKQTSAPRLPDLGKTRKIKRPPELKDAIALALEYEKYAAKTIEQVNKFVKQCNAYARSVMSGSVFEDDGPTNREDHAYICPVDKARQILERRHLCAVGIARVWHWVASLSHPETNVPTPTHTHQSGAPRTALGGPSSKYVPTSAHAGPSSASLINPAKHKLSPSPPSNARARARAPRVGPQDTVARVHTTTAGGLTLPEGTTGQKNNGKDRARSQSVEIIADPRIAKRRDELLGIEIQDIPALVNWSDWINEQKTNAVFVAKVQSAYEIASFCYRGISVIKMALGTFPYDRVGLDMLMQHIWKLNEGLEAQRKFVNEALKNYKGPTDMIQQEIRMFHHGFTFVDVDPQYTCVNMEPPTRYTRLEGLLVLEPPVHPELSQYQVPKHFETQRTRSFDVPETLPEWKRIKTNATHRRAAKHDPVESALRYESAAVTNICAINTFQMACDDWVNAGKELPKGTLKKLRDPDSGQVPRRQNMVYAIVGKWAKVEKPF